MYEKLRQKIITNAISLNSSLKGGIQFDFLQTSDGKKVAQSVLTKLQSYFTYPGTKCLLQLVRNEKDQSLQLFQNNYTKINYTPTNQTHTFPYSYCIVTSDETTYESLKESIQITHISENESLEYLQDYELVLCIDAPQVSWHVPHSIEITQEEAHLIDSYENACNNIELFESCQTHVKSSEQILSLLNQLQLQTKVTKVDYAQLLIDLNKEVTEKLQSLSFSAADMISSLSSGLLPDSIVELIEQKCQDKNIPTEYITMQIPLTLNEEAIAQSNKTQLHDTATKTFQQLREQKDTLLKIKAIKQEAYATILLHDFISGIREYMTEYNAQKPELGDSLSFVKSTNLLISNPQPITYRFDSYQSLILTGANSGGKTTLLEHIIQLYVLYDLCLPISGTCTIDTSVHSIYYFAKNKGGTKKGAFEQLLHKLSQVNPNAFILADEMEAVTEPSVAASIMASTISFFHTKNCRMILATHLGKILLPHISDTVRVDGIVAKGLDKNQNVIIDHNPVMGTIAESTPELIVQKMALKKKNDYLQHLAESFH